MNILFYTLGYGRHIPPSHQSDYQSDLLFHGLRTKFGNSVVDFPHKEYMYPNYPHQNKLWGKGFSYCGTLEEPENLPGMEEIGKKIYENFFDVIVLSVHHTIHKLHVAVYETLNHLSQGGVKSKIVVVDGNDDVDTYTQVFDFPLDLYLFKREIPDNLTDERIRPISFAIPAYKIIKDVPFKPYWLAPVIPADFEHKNRSTHTFTDEQSYYKSYQDAWFGLNSCKAGWCSMRIYEIMANGCLPIFTDLENCPRRTLVDLPKDILLSIKEIQGLELDKKVFVKSEIHEDSVRFGNLDTAYLRQLANNLLKYTKENLTTVALADRVLGEVGV